MTIRLKIFALATLLLVLFGIAVGVSLLLQERVDGEIAAISEYHLPITAAVAELDVITFEYELIFGRLLDEPTPTPERIAAVVNREREMRTQLKGHFNRAEELLARAIADDRNELPDRLTLSQIQGTFGYLKREVGPFAELGQRILTLYRAGQQEEAHAVLVGFCRFEQVFGPDLAHVRQALERLTATSTADTYRAQRTLRRYTIKKHDKRLRRCLFRYSRAKQLGDGLLAFSQRRACEGTGFHFEVHKCAKAAEVLGCTRREASGERGLACPGLPNEQNNAVEWKVRSMYLGTEGEMQERL